MTAVDVSVVIPTRGRPALLLRALDSVFAQSCPPREVVVVVDGPDEPTRSALAGCAHPALRVIFNPRQLTAAGARNAGVAEARGSWIAFLDDDDEWLPEKLEHQLAWAATHEASIVTCLAHVVTPAATYIWPEVPYGNDEPFVDYLFDRRSLFAGAAFLQTSSYLVRRSAYALAPFRPGTPHDDWDFVIRQLDIPGARLETVPEPLVVHYIDDRRPSLSTASNWIASLAWADEMRTLMTPRAYSGFCLCIVGPRAAGERALRAFPMLLRKAFGNGAPRIRHVVTYLAFWLSPRGLRQRVRALFRAAGPVAPHARDAAAAGCASSCRDAAARPAAGAARR